MRALYPGEVTPGPRRQAEGEEVSAGLAGMSHRKMAAELNARKSRRPPAANAISRTRRAKSFPSGKSRA